MLEAAKSEVGSFFGKYFLMKKLAAGGMGEIFLAKQQGPAGFQKVLVVKKILSHLTENKEFVEAFLGEARLAAQMNHRNVVQVYELGEESGAYFIAMEYVAGKSLRDLIDTTTKRKERLNPEHCRLVAEMICDGASYAHNLTDITGRSLNLVHRDLNPQNVLISYTGDVKVIDFGIAKSEMSTVKTEAGMIKGKFVYMSPEQSLAKKLDKRSDIFAIGISLYEMLTGINPFHKNNIVLTLEAVQRYSPPPPSEYDPSCAPFDPIVAKALAKDRDRRYGDAAEMMDDLRRVVLPRPAERLAQCMQRVFRAQVEEEQKLLMDSDRVKLTGSGPKRTPSRATPPPAKVAQVTAHDAPEGSTMMLPGTPARKPAGKKTGDTLLDGGEVVPPTPTVPHVEGEADEVPGGTALLNPAEARAAVGAGSTNILTPEESEAAQREALAKLEEAKRGVVRTRTRADKRTEMKARKSSRGMWIALGVGSLVAVGGIVALVFVLLAEDSASTPRPRRDSVAPVDTAQMAPGAEAAPDPKALGILTLNPGPNVPVTYGGNTLPRQIGQFSLPVTSNSGTIEIGDETTQFRVLLEYTVASGAMTFKVNSVPWAVASINGPSRGRTPIADVRVENTTTRVDLRQPGAEAAMTLRLSYRGN